jgi:glycogen(starch) synthase
VTRVALIPSGFAPHVGGVEILTDRLGRQLQREGNEVEIWTARTRGDGLPDEETMGGLRVRRFAFDAPRADLRTAAAWPLRAGDTLRRLHAAVNDFHPDVLHVQCFSSNGVYATLLSALLRTQLVVTLQGETFMDDQEIYDRSLYLRAGLRAGLRRATAVTACSRYTLNDAERRFGSVVGRGRVIFNGVDVDEVETGHWNPPYERFVLGLGRVVHRKGFDLLIRAWARVAEGHPGMGLVIGGDGPELQALHDLVDELSLRGNVTLVGMMSRAAIAGAMHEAEVFVMPSRVEAFGIVALEAWRAGTPAIVTSNGGPAEFVRHGVDGLVVDPLDTSALAVALETLLEDGQLRERLAREGRERSKAFAWSEISRQYTEVYADVLARRGCR